MFKKEDVYAVRAAKMFNVLLENVTLAMRQKAKLAMFGEMYGGARLPVSKSQEKRILRTFDLRKIEARMLRHGSKKDSDSRS